MEERRLRVQEQANRWDFSPWTSVMFDSRGLLIFYSYIKLIFTCYKNWDCDLFAFPHRKFSSSVILTPEEQEQRVLYASILEYEQDHVSVYGDYM